MFEIEVSAVEKKQKRKNKRKKKHIDSLDAFGLNVTETENDLKDNTLAKNYKNKIHREEPDVNVVIEGMNNPTDSTITKNHKKKRFSEKVVATTSESLENSDYETLLPEKSKKIHIENEQEMVPTNDFKCRGSKSVSSNSIKSSDVLVNLTKSMLQLEDKLLKKSHKNCLHAILCYDRVNALLTTVSDAVEDLKKCIEEPDKEMNYEGDNIGEEKEPCDRDKGEDISDEDDDHEEDSEGQMPKYPLRCLSVRIGSYKVFPKPNFPFIPIILAVDRISFQVPTITNPKEFILINLRIGDIQKVLVHFGRSLPIMFVFISPNFGEAVREALKMSRKKPPYFDPTSKDDKIRTLSFLIKHITEDQKQFIQHCFPGEKKVKDIDLKTANEILVKSTPNHLSVTKITLPPQPVVKLLTYPPPPQTGGIAITNNDLACLNDGEFLNDAIIDFYLKYVFYERLSSYQREKTHIFSSSFYPRLTHKPERPRAGDDPYETMQFRRHNEVKTLTQHVDIFSKDFIIIPVNQNVHWFLAIICYPTRVSDAPNIPSRVLNKKISSNSEDDSPNHDANSMASSLSSSYEVEEPPDSDEASAETPDGKQKKEMPCICIFDSLSGPNRWRIPNILREYLEQEWKSKKGTRKLFNKKTMQGFLMKCPQQTNYSDCGMYLLQFVESFFENPIPFGSPMPDLTNWFTELKISKKRQQLKDLILDLQKKQASALGARKTNQPDGFQSSSTAL